MIFTRLKKILLLLGKGGMICLITLLLLEIVLQVASRFIEKRPHPFTGKEAPLDGKLRIVMMGDSNTYGLYLKEDESYPSVFEKKWNARHPDQPVEVINLGFPGTNSSRVLKSIPDVIQTFSPDVITVMVGVNDYWMAPVETKEAINTVSPFLVWCREHVRIYKLMYMLRRQFYQPDKLEIDDEGRHLQFDENRLEQYKKSLDGGAPPVVGDKPFSIRYGDTRFDIGYILDVGRDENPAEDMKQNLIRMADVANAHGIKLVFISYAFYEYPQKMANWQMKAVSKSHGVDLINVAKIFRQECGLGEVRCQQLFFPDYHPSAEGYRVIAESLEQFFVGTEDIPGEE